MNKDDFYIAKQDRIFNAVQDAKEQERKDGKRRHVVVQWDDEPLVTEEMPFLGEWYDSDGIRHG